MGTGGGYQTRYGLGKGILVGGWDGFGGGGRGSKQSSRYEILVRSFQCLEALRLPFT